MIRIAIIQFPGLNTEYETRREINRAGMRGEFFRWNEPNAAQKLAKYDGFVIGGGFSYEDRGRAGIIASLDPIMKILKDEAIKGKPLLGICNGAQILVESGLIPGVDGGKLVMALARNKRMRNGEILGTGYYNAWVNLKNVGKNGSSMFTSNMLEGEIFKAPIAHGEGRFTTEIPGLIQELQAKGQMIFRYCDANGVITENFPVNPNGAMFNIAAVGNPAGNVMAIMPHLERSPTASEKLFTSMRDALLAKKGGSVQKKRTHHLTAKSLSPWPLPTFQRQAKSVQLFISLIITDNEAETFEITLQNLGWPLLRVKRKTHIELGICGKPDLQKLLRKLIGSGVLLNTNKEKVSLETKMEKDEQFVTYQLLIREKPDFSGLAKLITIQKRLKLTEITDVRTGTLWEIGIPTKSKNVAEVEFKKMISTNLFFNPHGQEAYLI